MDIKQLRVFLHLSKSLHFTKTSSECYVSASSLTRQIQRLEDEVGALLFERDNRTVRLTYSGELFREFALESLARWENLQQQLQQQSTTLAGRISVFCSVTASYYFLQELLEQFRLRYPAVEIHLHTGDTALTIQRILNEQEDIGIAAKPDKLPGTLQFLSIEKSPLVFIAPATQCPLQVQLRQFARSNQSLPWQEIPMILAESGLGRSRVNSWFRSRGTKPSIYAQVTGNEAIVSMVALGFGVGVVPRLVVDNSPVRNKVEILNVVPALEPFSIGICALKRKLSNPLIRAFWDLAHKEDL